MIATTEDLNKFVTANPVEPEHLLEKLAEHKQIVSPELARLIMARSPRACDKSLNLPR